MAAASKSRPAAAAATVIEAPIGKVTPAPDNPRSSVGDLAELAVSIRENGIIEPLVAVERDGGYLLVAGERRLAAAKLAGLDTVPLLVRGYDEQQRLVAMAIENLQREDLTPLEEAGCFQRLLDELGLSQRDLAARIGKTQSHISKRLALRRLPEDVQAKVDSGGITIADAVELAKLADHPDRIKSALAHEHWGIATAVEREQEEIEIERKIRQLEENAESRGTPTIRVLSKWQLPKGAHRLQQKGGSYYDMHALKIGEAEHAKFGCHTMAITTQDATPFWVCTDRKQHPNVKTFQEAERASKGKTAGPGAFTPPPERKEERELREARERRQQFAGKLASAKKPPKDALDLILRRVVDDMLEYAEPDDLASVAVWLGLLDPAAESEESRDRDNEEQLEQLALAGGTDLVRVAFALTLAMSESYAIELYLRGNNHFRPLVTPARYLAFLAEHGHELAPIEKTRLDTHTALPAAA